MIRSLLTWACLMIVAGFLLAGCSKELERGNYKITLQIRTKDGLKSGSSIVQRIKTWHYISGPRGVANIPKLIGVAPLVDLGECGTVAAALFYLKRAYPEKSQPLDYKSVNKDMRDIVNRAHDVMTGANAARYEVPLDMLPQFIWVPSELKSVEQIEAVRPKNFPATIGCDATLSSLTIVPTDEEMVELISPPLAWLEKLKWSVYDKSIRSTVGHDQFETGWSSGSFEEFRKKYSR